MSNTDTFEVHFSNNCKLESDFLAYNTNVGLGIDLHKSTYDS